MALGFIMIGMATGIAAAVLVLIMGAGVGTAVLAYAGCGSLGTGIAILSTLASQKSDHRDRHPAPSM
ncbi:MAG: hypothetical protein ABI832_23470 [bacterium]